MREENGVGKGTAAKDASSGQVVGNGGVATSPTTKERLPVKTELPKEPAKNARQGTSEHAKFTVDPSITFGDDQEELALLPELLSLVMDTLAGLGHKKTLLEFMLANKACWNLGTRAMFGKLHVTYDNMSRVAARFKDADAKDLSLLRKLRLDDMKDKARDMPLQKFLAACLTASPELTISTFEEVSLAAVIFANDHVKGTIRKLVLRGLNDFRAIATLSMSVRPIEQVVVIRPVTTGKEYHPVIRVLLQQAKQRRKWSIGRILVVGAKPKEGETVEDMKAFWKVVPRVTFVDAKNV